jgi:hypothetical protein
MPPKRAEAAAAVSADVDDDDATAEPPPVREAGKAFATLEANPTSAEPTAVLPPLPAPAAAAAVEAASVAAAAIAPAGEGEEEEEAEATAPTAPLTPDADGADATVAALAGVKKDVQDAIPLLPRIEKLRGGAATSTTEEEKGCCWTLEKDGEENGDDLVSETMGKNVDDDPVKSQAAATNARLRSAMRTVYRPNDAIIMCARKRAREIVLVPFIPRSSEP